MIEFEDQDINRDKLFNELIEAGLDLQPTTPYYCYLWRENGKVLIDTTENNRSKVQTILDSHNPEVDNKQKLLDKLGITEEEAKLLLSQKGMQ